MEDKSAAVTHSLLLIESHISKFIQRLEFIYEKCIQAFTLIRFIFRLYRSNFWYSINVILSLELTALVQPTGNSKTWLGEYYAGCVGEMVRYCWLDNWIETWSEQSARHEKVCNMSTNYQKFRNFKCPHIFWLKVCDLKEFDTYTWPQRTYIYQ